MSEADNTWRVEVDGAEHEIEVNYGAMTGKIEVTLDGVLMGEDRLWWNKEDVEFKIGEHVARVSVSSANVGFSARSALHFDGRYVEPLRR